jgi:hypothetical protein
LKKLFKQTKQKDKTFLNPITIGVLGILGFLILSGHWFCPFYHLFGIPCPGCFLTRALFLLVRGDFALAWQYNALIYVLPFLAIVWVILYFKNYKKLALKIIYLAIVIMTIYWLYRILFVLGSFPFVIDYSALIFRIM